MTTDEMGEAAKLIEELLYEHDPMCGHDDCRYTAKRIAPALVAALSRPEPAPTPASMLNEILARIHRDGGQYIEQHGLAKAVADADVIIARLYGERASPPASDDVTEREQIALVICNEQRRFHNLPPFEELADMEPHHYRDELRYADAILSHRLASAPRPEPDRGAVDPARLLKDTLFRLLKTGTGDVSYGGVAVADGKRAWLRFTIEAALATPPAIAAEGENDATALEGYRAAVSFISADSWDGCSDCIELLRAARSADYQHNWTPDQAAIALQRLRKHVVNRALVDHDKNPTPDADLEARARDKVARIVGTTTGQVAWWWDAVFDDGTDDTAARKRADDFECADLIIAALTERSGEREG